MLSLKGLAHLFCLVFLQVVFVSHFALGTVHQISIIDFAFSPPTDTIPVGDTVRWTNDGSFQHTSTSNTGVWNSPTLNHGQSFSFHFTSNGSFPYHCFFHPDMTGTIVVLSSDVKDVTGNRGNPSEFAISQNYPNPFNQNTKIDFVLARPGFTSLQVYDLLGRRVRTLVEENLSAGYKSVLWDGKNDSGKDVSSGIYFYRIEVADAASGGEVFSRTRKLLLLK